MKSNKNKIYERICILCGNKFITTSKTKHVCNSVHTCICEYCGRKFTIIKTSINYITGEHTRYCSRSCASRASRKKAEETSLKRYGVTNAGGTFESQEKQKKTFREKYGTDWYFQSNRAKEHNKEIWLSIYGVDNPHKAKRVIEKTKQTCLEKYGATNPLCKDSSIRHKIIQATIDKYGVDNFSKLPEASRYIRQKNIEKYGVPSAMCLPEIQEKAKQTNFKRYSVEYAAQSDIAKQHAREHSLRKYSTEYPIQSDIVKQHVSQSVQAKYGVDWPCQLSQCRDASGNTISKFNRTLGELLIENGVSVEYEFNIGRKSYDIYLVDKNTLLEIDPSYTHSLTADSKFGNIVLEYHQDKTRIAEEHGYRCIHIFDWDNIKQITNYLISKPTVIGARKCKVKEINKEIADQFLINYHFQGNTRFSQVQLGLFYNNKLIQVVTFGKPRYTNKFEYELLRLAIDYNFNIIGGIQKLFKCFIRKYQPNSIVSYCDRSKFQGKIYPQLGFSLQTKGIPSIHWSKGKEQISNNLLLKYGADALIGTHEGKGTDNKQIMLDHGWLDVPDCGQDTYIWRKDNISHV